MFLGGRCLGRYDGSIMCYDILLGKRRRNWARMGEKLMPTAPTPSSSLLLDRQLADAGLPPDDVNFLTATERLRNAAPGATKLYDKYRPTYEDHQVKLKLKL